MTARLFSLAAPLAMPALNAATLLPVTAAVVGSIGDDVPFGR